MTAVMDASVVRSRASRPGDLVGPPVAVRAEIVDAPGPDDGARRAAGPVGETRGVRVHTSRAVRWPLASVGVACVGLGAIGAFVPGMPTTVFLVVACWCFARSCPWLEARLVRVPLFGPFLKYLQPGVVMPRRAKIASIAVMWVSVGASCVWMLAAGAPWFAAAFTVVLAGVGTWFIARQGRAGRERGGAEGTRRARRDG